MDAFSYEILSLLKSGYLAAGERDDFEVHDIGPSFSARQFYVTRLEGNLIHSMDTQHGEEYRRGSGSELDDKMRALRSSSAMTFNLLGNGPVNVLWNGSWGSYEVSYEAQLPTRAIGLPANLDAVLGNKEHVIACEMKMLEWLLSKPGVLKSAYRRRERIATSGQRIRFSTSLTRYSVRTVCRFLHATTLHRCSSTPWRFITLAQKAACLA